MRFPLRSAAAAACLIAAAVNLNSLAQAREGAGSGQCHPRGEGAGPMGPEVMFEHGGPGPGWGPHPASLGGPAVPPWMRHLHLSEAQQDAVFNVLHEQEPTLRERFKAVRASREALHAAALTAGTDAARLRQLAETAGKADAELAVLTAQTDQKLLQILTPEQQQALQDCLPKAAG